MIRLLLAVAALSATPIDDEAIDTVSAALARGMAAEQEQDGRAMLAAARALELAGARDDAGLAGRWRLLARKQGVRDREKPFRGRALGPAVREGVLAPGAALATEQVFLAGQKAVVALVPQPQRNFGFRILASDQTSICERAVDAPRVSCVWMPLFTARMRIIVTNRSGAPARYFLVTN